MGGMPAKFKPDSPLTQSVLADLVAGLQDAGTGNSVRARRHGDDDGARRLARQGARARRRRRRVRPRGTQTRALRRRAASAPRSTARLLGLRTNHPTGQDSLELLPQRHGDTRRDRLLRRADPRPRRLGDRAASGTPRSASNCPSSRRGSVRSSAPRSRSSAIRTSGAGRARTRRRRSACRRPAASTAPASSGASTSSRPIPDAPQLSGTLRGRTTMQMSGEVPKASAIPFDELEPGDVLFFGARGPQVEAGAGQPHGDLPRQRLVHPLLRLRRRARTS